ncbi:MAG: phage tail sheath family protein [Sphingomonadaceae bacterium]|nr:phage tail sheath family protein [Sphingomonadaceae bacterium]
MAEYLAPGVFIEEIERGPRPIEGVATSTAAFLGETERGPVRPRLVTSVNDYLRQFGGAFGDDKFMPYALTGFFDNGGRRAYVCRLVGAGAVAAKVTAGGIDFEASGPGEWGNRIHLKLSKGSATAGTKREPTTFRLQVAYWDTDAPGDAYPDPFDPTQNRVLPRPTQMEDFDNLEFKDAASPDFYSKRLDGNSALVRLTAEVPAPLAALQETALTPLAGGVDGAALTKTEFVGSDPDNSKRTGLSALELDEYREVALVAAPGVTDTDIVKAVYEHCERNRFRFAVIDSKPNVGNASTLDPRTDFTTSYAAFYYPWVYVSDLRTGVRRKVPPSGHVLGLYARTDNARGVWKAPANDTLSDVFDLEYYVDTGTQEVLNPRGVNVIRRFPARGIRVWGARTLSDNALWKYVNVRRLFIFLEHSIYDATQWVVFEPNDERLWARVKDTIRLFLRTQWRNGAMMGLTEDEAFTIACDRSTMTQDDILNGRLVCEIGIAPVRPAEFVVFRIFQNTAEAQS